MSALLSASARATADSDSKQHFAALEREGLLGIRRPVRVLVSAFDPDITPPADAKVVHFIRHGQGFHNLLGDLWHDIGVPVEATGAGGGGGESSLAKKLGSPYMRPEITDPPLTAIGRAQAKDLRSRARELTGVELVVVSPLCRAVQTALLAFGHMLSIAPGGGAPTRPFVGHPDTVENSGLYNSDRRRAKDEISADFPMVDWSLVEEGDDPRWSATSRESARAVSDRAHAFLRWLRARGEREVAVATHSAWLFNMLNTACECDPDAPELAGWFMTGEMRSLVLRFRDDPGAGDDASDEGSAPPTKRPRAAAK